MVATALTGAAGSDVTGSVGGLVQGAAVNVIQSKLTTEVKYLVDTIADPAKRETARTALQGLLGCAGATAGGSGSCGSAATGAAASVVVNNILASFDKEKEAPRYDEQGRLINPVSVEDQERRKNIAATIVGAIAQGAGLDANAATTAAQIETENNKQYNVSDGLGKGAVRVCTGGELICQKATPFSKWGEQQKGPYRERWDTMARHLGRGATDGQIAAALEAYYGAIEQKLSVGEANRIAKDTANRISEAEAFLEKEIPNSRGAFSRQPAGYREAFLLAFAKSSDTEKAAWAERLRTQSLPKLGQPMTAGQFNTMVSVYGGKLPSAVTMNAIDNSSVGALAEWSRSPDVQAMVRRYGPQIIKTPEGALIGTITVGGLIVAFAPKPDLLPPSALPGKTKADDFEVPPSGIDPKDPKQKPKLPAPPILPEQPENEVGKTADGRTIYKDKNTGQEYTKNERGERISWGQSGTTDASSSVDQAGRPKISIRDHYKHHLAMVDDLKDQLRNLGYTVSEKEISYGSVCGTGRCRPDIIYKRPDGKIVGIIEVKTGDADLSIRQTDIFPQIRDGNAIPRGDVASNFGLQPGIPLKDQGYPNGIPVYEQRFPGVEQ